MKEQGKRGQMWRVGRWMLVVGILVWGTGCFIEPWGDFDDDTCVGAGDLTVTWAFDGFSRCPADVEFVFVQVIDPDGFPVHTTEGGDVAECLDGQVVYANIPCGNYRVRVVASDIENPSDDLDLTWTAPQVTKFVRDQAPPNVVLSNMFRAP